MSINTVKYLQSLAATNSRTDKEQILIDAWMNGERDLFSGAKLAYDIMINFGVKKIAEIVDAEDDGEGSVDWTEFNNLAQKLRKRELTGNAARDAIKELAERSNVMLWNEFYRRVLLKDLRAGLSEKTVNKVLEKLGKSDADALNYVIPVFSCQLAKDGNDESHTKKLNGRKQLDIKLDGVRLLTVCDIESKSVTQYTRNGLQNDNFPHIRAIFEQMLDDLPCSLVFDGEITGKTFQTLMKQVNRKEKLQSTDTKLALFDCVPLADFKAGKCEMVQSDRHTVLTGFMGKFTTLSPNEEVYVVPKKLVDLDTPEGKKSFNEFNQEAIEAGYEGIMVKDPDAPYETKRTAAWLKIKPFIEISMTIVGFEEGTGKNVGKLGAIIGELEACEETGGRNVRSNVGSGLSDDDRAEIWNNRTKYMGFIMEVKADCFTQEQNGGDWWSLRFPRFKGFRGTKKGEKL